MPRRRRSAGQKALPPPAAAAPAAEPRELAALGPADLEIRLARHQYSLGVVAGSLALVLCAGTRLQRVPEALALAWKWSGRGIPVASYFSVRLWLLRLGLYQLRRAKQRADDWMWIADHTIQLGPWKCLIVLGIRQSAWNAQRRVLRHEDVDLIDLVPVTDSNGQVVYRQLGAMAAVHGVPRAITSDGGCDLHAGIERFCQAHPETAWLYDIKHKTACLLKHALASDAVWPAFTEQAHRFKQQVSLTPLAALAPPQQRSKARYMNLDVLVDWASASLAALEHPGALRKAGLKRREVEEKLGWLWKFETPLRRWREMLCQVGLAEHYVRHEGIHVQASAELGLRLPKSTIPAVQRLRKNLLEFVAAEARLAHGDERLLGSSEVLESVIGKFKHVAGERGAHGLTGMVLSLAALVGKPTLETVQAALAETPTAAVWDWCREHLGPSVQGVRQRLRHALHPEHIQKTLSLESG